LHHKACTHSRCRATYQKRAARQHSRIGDNSLLRCLSIRS
jgi:hypothetical protein